MAQSVELKVNGRARHVQADYDQTLLTVLRDLLQLKGAKRGCNQGVCGACTVMIDDRPMRSCLLLAANCGGASIITVEGLIEDRIGRVLQKAFVACGAIQCGFCTAGMLVSSRMVLERNPSPTTDDIRREISGNLCRCTGYRKIIEAISHAAGELAHE